MPREGTLGWRGGGESGGGPGGFVSDVGINHAPPALAIDPDEPTSRAEAPAHPAGPAPKVERLDTPPEAVGRGGRVRLRRS